MRICCIYTRSWTPFMIIRSYLEFVPLVIKVPVPVYNSCIWMFEILANKFLSSHCHPLIRTWWVSGRKLYWKFSMRFDFQSVNEVPLPITVKMIMREKLGIWTQTWNQGWHFIDWLIFKRSVLWIRNFSLRIRVRLFIEFRIRLLKSSGFASDLFTDEVWF
jgi:hypothetical protein